MKKTVYFDHLRPWFLSTNEDGVSNECIYDLNGLLDHISKHPLHEVKRKLYGDYHLFHTCSFDDKLKIWEIQILHLREKILPGIADTDGSYELIKLNEGEYPAESTTILYDKERCTFYMQRNIYGTSIRVLEAFLQELSPERTSVLLKPKLRGNQLNKITAKKLYRKVLLVADVDQLEEKHQNTTLGRTLREFGRYQGKIVTIGLGFGRERKGLLRADETANLVREAYAYNGTHRLEVSESDSEDISFEAINLLDDRATYKVQLEYKRDNPITHNRLFRACCEAYKQEMGIE